MNPVYSAGANADFHPINDRLYAPDQDGKTENDHFAKMLANAVCGKGIKAKHILFAGWHASVDNLRPVNRLDLIFLTRRTRNRVATDGDIDRVMTNSPDEALTARLRMM